MPAPYFDSHGLPRDSDAYVAWLDVMGVRAWMMRSLPISANFIFKLHIVALEEKQPNMRLYPVMDGVYAVATNSNEMRQFLTHFFSRMAQLFNSEPAQEHRFLVKAAVAFGPIIHGAAVGAVASNTLSANCHYRDAILLGMPMVFAHQSEPNAPPFGVYIHDSARDLLLKAELKRSHCWWPWFTLGATPEAQTLRTEIQAYFDWCEKHAGALQYRDDRIRAHRSEAAQYLVDA